MNRWVSKHVWCWCIRNAREKACENIDSRNTEIASRWLENGLLRAAGLVSARGAVTQYAVFRIHILCTASPSTTALKFLQSSLAKFIR